MFKNPILPGFYPDPSVCRVEDDYYLVTSTFSYFPGIPIFHSKDLVHWNQIGNVLTRPDQIPLEGGEHSQGIFAPTIRYHKGTFYVITTNVSGMGNFIVTAANPAGPWSDPYILGSNGIDPSLFFDEDDRCYYCGTQSRREGSAYFGDNEIYIQELDLSTMKLTGPSYAAWHGALRDVVWPEGPHLYKKDGWYYLMISEAGTAHEHAVTVARSRDLTKPFEGYRCNPILTHRHLGVNYPIVNVGHPDIVETQNGEWWMVCLASRPYGGYFRNLGRETFLVPFSWENGWPLINPGRGIVEDSGKAPSLPNTPVPDVLSHDDFDDTTLSDLYLFLRNPKTQNYDLTSRPSFLSMHLAPEKIGERTSPTLLLRRQTAFSYQLSTNVSFTPNTIHEAAGLVIMQSDDDNLQFLLEAKENKGVLTPYLCVYRMCKGEKECLIQQAVASCSSYLLRMNQTKQQISFLYSVDHQKKPVSLLSRVDTRFLSTDCAGGFVGNCMGIYATSNGTPSNNVAAFDDLSYENL